MTSFIWSHKALYNFQKIPIYTIVDRMPHTFLRLDELARIEVIKTFLIDDLWNKQFVEEIALTKSEQKAVDSVGLKLFGSKNLFNKF